MTKISSTLPMPLTALAVTIAVTLGAASSAALAKPPGGPGGDLFGADRIDAHLERMTDQLDLTTAQQQDIRAILEDRADNSRSEHEALRAQIDAVLTDEQRALRDERMQQRLQRRLDRMAERLDLSDAQRDELAGIMAEKVADPSLSRAELRERMATVLTEEQLDELSRSRGRRQGGPHWGGPGGDF